MHLEKWKVTNREPLDALQFKQWQSELNVGRELRGRVTVIRPQLQAPWIVSEASISIKKEYHMLGMLREDEGG